MGVREPRQAEDSRPARHRRHQRRAHRSGRGRARPRRSAVREGRPCRAHLIGQHQADPRRAPLRCWTWSMRPAPESHRGKASIIRYANPVARCWWPCPKLCSRRSPWFFRVLKVSFSMRQRAPGAHHHHDGRFLDGQVADPCEVLLLAVGAPLPVLQVETLTQRRVARGALDAVQTPQIVPDPLVGPRIAVELKQRRILQSEHRQPRHQAFGQAKPSASYRVVQLLEAGPHLAQ